MNEYEIITYTLCLSTITINVMISSVQQPNDFVYFL